MMLTVTTEDSVEDHGSVLLLSGTDEAGVSHRFGADRRMALDLIEAAREFGEVQAEVEDWQLWGA